MKHSYKTMIFPSHTGPLQYPRKMVNELKVLQVALKDTPATYTKTSGGYRIQVQFPSGRTQTVTLNFSQQDIFDQPIITCLTYCGQVTRTSFNEAIHLNSRPGYGALALKPHPNGHHLVMTETQLYQNVDPFELRGIILHLASRADHFERKISEVDQY